MVDILGYRRKIGMIVESGNSVAAPDAGQMALTGITIHTSDLSPGQEARTAIGDAAARVLAKDVHAVALLIDEAFLDGVATEAAAAIGQVPLVDMETALTAAFDKSGFSRRIGVVSPFSAGDQQRAIAQLEKLGATIVGSAALDRPETAAQSHTSFVELRAAVDGLAQQGAETIVQLGHNLPLVRLIDNIEEDLGRPVLAANQVCLWQALRTLGVDDVVPGVGRLFMEC